jgi:hypothetical protein
MSSVLLKHGNSVLKWTYIKRKPIKLIQKKERWHCPNIHNKLERPHQRGNKKAKVHVYGQELLQGLEKKGKHEFFFSTVDTPEC